MPIYEYKCRICNEHFEVEQSFTDEALTEIDGCTVDESSRHQVKKIFVAPAISFKGDGFYRNDARSSSGAKKPAGSDESSETSSDRATAADSATTSDSSSAKSAETSPSTSSNGAKAPTTSSQSSSGD